MREVIVKTLMKSGKWRKANVRQNAASYFYSLPFGSKVTVTLPNQKSYTYMTEVIERDTTDKESNVQG